MTTRREVLALMGLTGPALWVRAARAEAGPPDTLPACIATPRQTQGPYFVDARLERADIRSDPADGSVSAGLPLALGFRVSAISSAISGAACAPLAGAVVDLWHCDAAGVYSDTRDPGFDTVGHGFLRGYQRTDAQGIAQFTTIYPGWYPWRTVHLHFKIRAPIESGRHYEFTSQLYFDDLITDRVHAEEPYVRRGPRTVRNERDGIFRAGGAQLLLALAERGAGYAAMFEVGLRIA